jgi:hypothetical protein
MNNSKMYISLGGLAICFALIVFVEGAVRKWVSGSLGLSLILLRDILAISVLMYISMAAKYKGLRQLKIALWLYIGLIFFYSMVQTFFMGLNPVVPLVGVRFWALYPVFGILLGWAMSKEDFYKFSKFLLYFGISVFPLVILQYMSAPDSFINKEVGESEFIFVLAEGIVRTTGTFSFTLGQSSFVMLYLSFVCVCIMDERLSRRYGFGVWLGFISALIMAYMSGSRAVIISSLVILFFLFVYVNFSSRLGGKVKVHLYLYIVAALVLVPILLPESLDAIFTRFSTASESEDIVNRLSIMFFGSDVFNDDFRLFGHGLGAGSNVVAEISGFDGFSLAEAEPSRMILEGGILGILVLFVKFIFVGVLMVLGLKEFLLIRNFKILIIAITGGIAMVSWPVSGQLTSNALIVIYFILCFGTVRFLK